MTNLCCVLNARLMCFDCSERLCTNCSFVGKLNARPIYPKGIYVLCKKCLDSSKEYQEYPFITAAQMDRGDL